MKRGRQRGRMGREEGKKKKEKKRKPVFYWFEPKYRELDYLFVIQWLIKSDPILPRGHQHTEKLLLNIIY